jgi:NAD(P)-dependent dehydrogenase (short-subunit alcohol dehydrogenase family)
MEGKVCLVTGATGGIGLVTALELARQGARVIGVGRSPDRCAQAAHFIHEQSDREAPSYLNADLSSQAEIRRLADEVKTLTGRLDVLVNNAGGLFLSRQETVDGLEMTFALNHMAYFLLTNLLLDLVKLTPAARIVSVSSEPHQSGTIQFDDLQTRSKYSFWRAYRQSKLANILFTRELARRLEGSGVTANCLHPGYVRTQIFELEGVRGWLLRRLADALAISPERGAETSIYMATSPEVEDTTGLYFVSKRPAATSPAARDDAAARRLWHESEALCGIEVE